MSYHLSLTQTAPSTLFRITYRWWLDEHTGLVLTLDEVVHESRQSRRHGWRVLNRWSRLDQRGNTMERPEVPANVLEEARAKVNAELAFA